MGLLESLFSSATAFLTPIKQAVENAAIDAAAQFRRTDLKRDVLLPIKRKAEDAVISAAAQIRKSQIGQELERFVKKAGKSVAEGVAAAARAVNEAYRGAKNVFEEEQEYARKRARDGRLNESDEERLHELRREREQLKQEINDLKAGVAAVQLQTESVIATLLSADELSANTGILASKTCPECGGTMWIRQGNFDKDIKAYKFWWECVSNLNGYRCRTVKLDPRVETPEVIRTANPDLDGDAARRRQIWQQTSVLQQTHARVRALLGELDRDLMCPVHVLPMRLTEVPRPGGRLLDSYQYTCSSLQVGKTICNHVIAITTFPQVAALLRRQTARGIIDQ